VLVGGVMVGFSFVGGGGGLGCCFYDLVCVGVCGGRGGGSGCVVGTVPLAAPVDLSFLAAKKKTTDVLVTARTRPLD